MGAMSQRLVEHIGRYLIRYQFYSSVVRLDEAVWRSKTWYPLGSFFLVRALPKL